MTNPSKSKEWASKFYRSFEWRSMRHDILKRDGSSCVICGRTPKDGARMNVDHKLPLRKFPELALEPDNLQVLCSACNHGKENKVLSGHEKETLNMLIGEAVYGFGYDEPGLLDQINDAFLEGGYRSAVGAVLLAIHEIGEIDGAQTTRRLMEEKKEAHADA